MNRYPKYFRGIFLSHFPIRLFFPSWLITRQIFTTFTTNYQDDFLHILTIFIAFALHTHTVFLT
jgi:hypothetical protein